MADHLRELLQDRPFNRQVLGGRLEHVVAIGEIPHLHRRNETRLDRLRRLRMQLSPRQTLVHIAAYALHPRIERFLLYVEQVDLASLPFGQG